jgi:hypothetical protein
MEFIVSSFRGHRGYIAVEPGIGDHYSFRQQTGPEISNKRHRFRIAAARRPE